MFRPKGVFCKCGHIDTLHTSYRLETDTAAVTKCFGADETAYMSILSVYDLNSVDVSQRILLEEVKCPCKYFIPNN
jgi:hypothetical protein